MHALIHKDKPVYSCSCTNVYQAWYSSVMRITLSHPSVRLVRGKCRKLLLLFLLLSHTSNTDIGNQSCSFGWPVVWTGSWPSVLCGKSF